MWFPGFADSCLWFTDDLSDATTGRRGDMMFGIGKSRAKLFVKGQAVTFEDVAGLMKQKGSGGGG